MSVQNYQAYQQNSVQTASPGELTLMLYNGCIKFIKFAQQAIEKKDIESKNTNIQKAQNIMRELMITLDPEVPISKEIMPLYDFINQQLIQANTHNDQQALHSALDLITDFRDTWKEVVKKTRKQKFGTGASV
ncbi:flagellar export chaperone FliS [Terribacillus saccharophilus]|uniref:flagellar export chaperone FliS n=1 Tax=Terribacillus saccharophilus TaxID=361277 RepID=UPI000BA68B5D|nr:flagellar export chaperone FliS [Terribacillus saccharophilus]PAF22709.1 flagellar export chaperone FliS [Terribacillus saccharophilus]